MMKIWHLTLTVIVLAAGCSDESAPQPAPSDKSTPSQSDQSTSSQIPNPANDALADAKPVDTKPGDVKPADVKPADVKPADMNGASAETKPSAMADYRKAQQLMKEGKYEEGYNVAQKAMQQFIADGDELAWMMLESIEVGDKRVDVAL